MSSSDEDVVELPGYTCPAAVLRLAVRLEFAGCRFSVRRNRATGPLLVVSGADGMRPAFDDETRAAITRWKTHLIALVDWLAERPGSDVAGP